MMNYPQISAIMSAKKNELRRRALFWHFGGFAVEGSDSQGVIAARLALGEIIDFEGGQPDLSLVMDFVLACSTLRSGFNKTPIYGEFLIGDRSVIKNTFIPNLCQLNNVGGEIVVEARIPWGQILADGIEVVSTSGLIRTCLWCQNLFAPKRNSAFYCCSACRGAHANRTKADNAAV